MAESQDRHDSSNGDAKKNTAGEAKEVEQQAEAPAAAPEDKPRRPRLYGYDPDHWPELG
jgi:hypothetical protein